MSETALFSKIQRSTDWPTIKKIVKDYPNIQNARDSDGKTVLHIAAETGNLPLVTMLISNKKVDVNAVDYNEWSALHCAANAGHFNVCITLLTKAKSINVNLKNKDHNSVLVYLTRLSEKFVMKGELKNYMKVLELMISRGADVKSTNVQGEGPLHFASLRGTIYSVHFLLQNGANVNETNEKKETALHWAVRRSAIDIIKALMEHGADPCLASSTGATPMGMALESNSKEIATLMNDNALFCKEAIREHAKAGFLERHIRKSKWDRVYCVLKEKLFFVYKSDNPDEKPIGTFDICEFSIIEQPSEKHKYSKQHSFMFEGEFRTATFGAQSEFDRMDWVKSIACGRQIHLHTQNSRAQRASFTGDPTNNGDTQKESTKEDREVSVMESDEINGNLVRALGEPGNDYCADCNAPQPFWLLVTYGALVCYECGAIHAKLESSSVKSVHYDSWLVSDSMKLKSNGNRNHNTRMEPNILGQKPGRKSSLEEKERYIKLKYLSNDNPTATLKKVEPSEKELKQIATANRGLKFGSIYYISQLLKVLCIPETMWKALKTTSCFKQIRNTIEDKNSDPSAILNSLDGNLKAVSGYANGLLPGIISFVRALKVWNNSEAANTERILLNIVKTLSLLQNTVFDSHIQLILKWWFPQALEVFATIRASGSEVNCTTITNNFCINSVKAIYLLTGEYLVLESNISTENEDLGKQVDNIEKAVHNNTKNVRELLANTLASFKSQSESTHSGLSFSEDTSRQKSIKMMKRESSANLSCTSTGDHSERTEPTEHTEHEEHEHIDSFITHEETFSEYPLLTFVHQTPYSVADTLCSIVSKIPEDAQKNLLGLVSTGQSFIEVQHSTPDVFSSKIQSTNTVISLLHSHAESLRVIWEEFNSETESEPLINLLLRQVFIFQRILRLLYGFDIEWTLPEVWNCWKSLQNLSHQVIGFLMCSAKQCGDSTQVSKVLCLLVVQLRWTIKKLREVQRIDICAYPVTR